MSIKYILIKTSLILFLLIAFCTCQKEESENETPAADRTIIVYMAADNDLSYDAFESLQQMEQGFSESHTQLIVFFDQGDGNPCLAEVHPGKNVIVKSYPELNSADPDVLKRILQDAIGLYPAQEYGLI